MKDLRIALIVGVSSNYTTIKNDNLTNNKKNSNLVRKK